MRTYVNAHRRLTLAAVAAVAAVGSTGIAISQEDAPSGPDAPFFFAGEQEIRAEAARRAPAVPLPARGSFDDIKWGDLGDSTGSEIQGLLEANAACDWWSALADRSDADAARVVQEIPGWSSMRGGGNVARDAQRVAAAAQRGEMREVAAMARVCHAPPRERMTYIYPDCSSSQARPDAPCVNRQP